MGETFKIRHGIALSARGPVGPAPALVRVALRTTGVAGLQRIIAFRAAGVREPGGAGAASVTGISGCGTVTPAIERLSAGNGKGK